MSSNLCLADLDETGPGRPKTKPLHAGRGELFMKLRSKKLLVLETILQLERPVNLGSPTWMYSRLTEN